MQIDFTPVPLRARLLGDKSQIEQVVLNLCLNARDAMPDGGRIRIALAEFEPDAALRERHPVLGAGAAGSRSRSPIPVAA